MKKNYLNKIRARTSPEIKTYVSKSFDVSDRIYELMQAKGLNQKELAKKMGKSPSQIHEWLSGSHNFTLKTITDLEIQLEGKILTTPKKSVEKEVAFWKELFEDLQQKVNTFYQKTPKKYISPEQMKPTISMAAEPEVEYEKKSKSDEKE